MKHLIAITIAALSLVFVACSKETQDEFDEAGDQIKDAADATGKAIQSGAEDAAETLKEHEAEPLKTETKSPTHKH